MAYSNKYHRPEGCAVCSIQHSSSVFRRWYEVLPEEDYCRIFKLQTLDGRRGYICNPCVLYMKRAIQSLDNPSKSQLQNPPDHTKRLDCKRQKGSFRPVIADIWPPDWVGAADQTATTKDHGPNARNMKFRSRYVFTGRPFVKLQSTYQLVPAGPWRDPRDFLEQEDDAEKDLKYYRRVTLKQGVKTLKEKEEEKRRKEAKKDEKLFGEITDDSHQHDRNLTTSKEDEHNTRSKRKKSVSQAANRSERKGATKATPCGTRAKSRNATEESVVGGKEDLSKDTKYLSKKTEVSDDEGANGEKTFLDLTEAARSSPVSTDATDEPTSSSSAVGVKDNTEHASIKQALDEKAVVSCRNRRNTSTESTEAIQGKRLCVQNNNSEGDDDEIIEEEDEDHHSDSREPRLSSMQTKKKNRRTIREPVKNLKPRNVSFMDCSYWQKFPFCCFDLYMGEGRNAVIRLRTDKRSCPVMLKHMDRLRQQGKKPQIQATPGAEEEEAASKIVEKTEVVKGAAASSSLSSGNEKLSDNRNNFTINPEA